MSSLGFTNWTRRTLSFLGLAAAFLISITQLHAQDMEPRAYSNAPIGTNFFAAGYAYSSGEVSLDPTVPITDIEADINQGSIGYSRFFALGGRIASASGVIPLYDADLSGNVEEDRREISRSGIGDLRFRLAMNLLGGPALTREQFAQHQFDTTVGVSLSFVAPTGEYTSQRLINVGANRWALKPEIGISQPFGDWFIEGSSGLWLFSDNDNFYGGQKREQDPIGTFQLHAGYNFRPGLWLAADANYWRGGQTTLGGDQKNDSQSSTRYGLTLSVPLSDEFSVKLAWTNGLRTRIGGDFDTVLALLQYRWFDN